MFYYCRKKTRKEFEDDVFQFRRAFFIGFFAFIFLRIFCLLHILIVFLIIF